MIKVSSFGLRQEGSPLLIQSVQVSHGIRHVFLARSRYTTQDL